MTAGVPADTANTTPFTILGVIGDAMSRDVQPGCSEGAPSWSASFHAVTEFPVAPRSQRVPAGSCHEASAPVIFAAAVFVIAAVGFAASTMCRFPSAVAPAIRVLSLYWNTRGEVVNGEPAGY